MEFWKMESVWDLCVRLGCVVVPIRVYSQYGDDGNVSEQYFTGLKFRALPFQEEAVGPDYYFGIEEHVALGDDQLDEFFHDTPEAAVIAYARGSGGAHDRVPDPTDSELIVNVPRGQPVTLDFCLQIGGRYNGDHGSGDECQFKALLDTRVLTVSMHPVDGSIVTSKDLADDNSITLMTNPTCRQLVHLIGLIFPKFYYQKKAKA